MGFLGYQPDRLVALRRAIGAAVTEATTLRCDDPAASAARSRWRQAVQLISPWEERVAGIVACAFGSPYRPVTVRDQLPVDHLRPGQPWTVVHDPLSAPLPTLDPLDRVDELATLLPAVDAVFLADRSKVRRLDELLRAVFGDQAAGLALLALLGADGFARVVNRLTRCAIVVDGNDARPGAFVVLTQLATGLGLMLKSGHLQAQPFRRALLEGPAGDPHAMAMVLRHGSLPTGVTVAWVHAVLTRTRSMTEPGLEAFVTTAAERTGDLVLHALLMDPKAGRAVLADLDELDLLLGSHLDGRLRRRFLVAVTTPDDDTSRAECLALLTSTLGYLGAHRDLARSTADPLDPTSLDGTRDLHQHLGALLGPWLLDLDLSASASPWGDQTPAATVAWIAEHPGAALDLMAWVVLHGQLTMGHVPGSPVRITLDQLVDAGVQLGTVIAVLRQGRLSQARVVRADYDGFVGAVKFVTGDLVAWAATKVYPPAQVVSPVIDWLAARALDEVEDTLVDEGLIHPPPNASTAQGQADAQSSVLAVTLLHLAALGAHAREREGGRRRTEAPPTPRASEHPMAYTYRIERWSRGVPARRAVYQAVTEVHDALATGRTVAGDPTALDPEHWRDADLSKHLLEVIDAHNRSGRRSTGDLSVP